MYLVWILLATLFYHAFSSFFLIIDLFFLIPAVIVHILNPTAELVTPNTYVTYDVNAEI